MSTKFRALFRIIKSRKFVLLSVPRDSLTIDVINSGSKELSSNILIMTKLLMLYENIKQEVTDQAAEAGQVRNLQSIIEAVKALEVSEDVRK